MEAPLSGTRKKSEIGLLATHVHQGSVLPEREARSGRSLTMRIGFCGCGSKGRNENRWLAELGGLELLRLVGAMAYANKMASI